MSLVCSVDGVSVERARSGRLVHVEAIPKGTDPDHEVDPVPSESFWTTENHRTDLKSAAEDMLLHHATTHPLRECEWAARLRDAMR